MSSAKEEVAKEVDIFRDTPVRLLGYSNEVRHALQLCEEWVDSTLLLPILLCRWARPSAPWCGSAGCA